MFICCVDMWLPVPRGAPSSLSTLWPSVLLLVTLEKDTATDILVWLALF